MSIPSSNAYKDTYRNVLRYTGQNYRFVPTYLRNRDPIAPQSASPDVKPFEQQGFYPVNTLWTNVEAQRVWLLAGISNGLGNWINISSAAAGTVDILTSSGIVSPVGGEFDFSNMGGNVVVASPAPGIVTFDASPVLEELVFRLTNAGVDVSPQASIINFDSPLASVSITRTLPNTINFEVPGAINTFSTDFNNAGALGGTVVPYANNVKVFGIDATFGSEGILTRARQTVNPNDTIFIGYRSAIVTTNNAIPTFIDGFTFATPGTATFTLYVTANNPINGQSFGARMLVVADSFGGVAVVTAELENVSSGSGALAGCLVNVVAVGNSINYMVTGVASTTINWAVLTPVINNL